MNYPVLKLKGNCIIKSSEGIKSSSVGILPAETQKSSTGIKSSSVGILPAGTDDGKAFKVYQKLKKPAGAISP